MVKTAFWLQVWRKTSGKLDVEAMTGKRRPTVLRDTRRRAGHCASGMRELSISFRRNDCPKIPPRAPRTAWTFFSLSVWGEYAVRLEARRTGSSAGGRPVHILIGGFFALLRRPG